MQFRAIISLAKEDIESLKNIYNLIEKQQKEIEKLKERNQELDKIEFVITNTLPPDVKYNVFCSSDFKRLFGNDYISKDKIREKKEKYEKDYKRQEKEDLFNLLLITAGKILALTELLKEN